jgi:nucleotide-binding universal stress UspA family protein
MDKIKVLIPTDFSIQSDYAYIMVSKLNEHIDVEVHFLHVLNVPDTVTLSPTGVIETCGEIDVNYVRSQKQIAERKLQQLVEVYGTHVNTALVFGRTTDSIVEYAEKNNFELIVMGTKGAWGLKEKISGSETQMIARKSRIPLLSLMCDRSELEIKNLLMVHNYLEEVKIRFDLFRKIVKAFHPKIHLLQMTDSPDKERISKIHEAMDTFARQNELEGYEKHVIQDKDVENGVIHFNQMNNMDLICIGTHAKGGIFHSSATEKLINHMYKPIISFHLN